MLMARDEISVRELAKRTGYSTSAIVKYRKGLWSVSLTRVYRIAEALGCSVYDLIDESVA
jgi:transcriptional regulator with XRE-family HTH domain